MVDNVSGWLTIADQWQSLQRLKGEMIQQEVQALYNETQTAMPLLVPCMDRQLFPTRGFSPPHLFGSQAWGRVWLAVLDSSGADAGSDAQQLPITPQADGQSEGPAYPSQHSTP